MSARVALALCAVLAAAGCKDKTTDDTAWDLVLQQIRPDGTVSVDTARAAYVLAFAPLPGVPDPPGKKVPMFDGTLALEWIEQHRDELTPEQKSALDQQRPCYVPYKNDAALETKYSDLADAASTAIANNVGIARLPIAVVLNADEVAFGSTAAYAYACPVDANNDNVGPYVSCSVRFNRSAEAATDRAIHETVPHEVFHCYQSSRVANISDEHEMSRWIVEGGAEWAGATIAGHADVPYSKIDNKPGASWRYCLTRPTVPLYQRSYDGICYFAQLETNGRSPWTNYDAIVTGWLLGGDDGAFVGGAHDEAIFDSWSSNLLRHPALGPEWDFQGPGITDDFYMPPQFRVANGDVATETLPGVTNNVYNLSVSSEVIVVRTPLHARLHSSDPSGFATDAPGGAWCVTASSCDCPMNSARAGEHLAMMPADQYFLAVSGALGGATWFAVGMTLDDYCNSDRVEKCLQGSWVMETAGPLPAANVGDTVECTFHEPIGTVVTFDAGGASSEDFSSSSPVTCTSKSMTSTTTLSGRNSALVVADHGYLQATMIDNSGVTVHSTLDGMDLGMGLSSVFGKYTSGSASLTYACDAKAMKLTMTNATGVTYTFGR